MSADFSDPVIAYRGRQRWVQTFEAMRIDKARGATPRLREGGVYLITGGLGQIGFLLAQALAEQARARLVLTGRRRLPARDEWKSLLAAQDCDPEVARDIRKILALEDLGAEVLTASADVADPEQMRELMALIDAHFGELHGVIHAAGAAGRDTSRAISDMRREDCERHFQPKARGLIMLEKCLEGRSLDFCLLFSSLSSVLGGLGYGAYSAANAFMDVFALRHNQMNPDQWTSVNWDGWDFRGQVDRVSENTSSMAELAIKPDEGVEAFNRILSSGATDRLVVSTGDLQSRIDRWVKLESLLDTEQPERKSSPSHPRPDLQNDYVGPRNEIEQTIAGIWETQLGLERVGVYDNFFELGGDSILSIQVISRANRLGLQFTAKQLFQHSTVAELASVVSIGESGEAIPANRPIAMTEEQQKRAPTLSRSKGIPDPHESSRHWRDRLYWQLHSEGTCAARP